MRQFVWGLVFLAAVCCVAEGRSVVKRQIHLEPSLDPSLQETALEDDEDRDKRAVNHPPDPKFAIKNALLGFVFNKINSFIDQKTAWVSKLDQLNVAKNHAHGIYPPEDSVASIAGAISGVIGQKLQAAGPLISLVTSKITSGSLGGSAQGSTHGSGGGSANVGFSLGGLLGGGGGGGGGTSGHAEQPSKTGGLSSRPKATTTKRPTTTEDIAIFEKNVPVSLDIPDQLYGSGFTLVTRLSTTAGDYMINSALRLQRFLEIFRPLLRAIFGVNAVVIDATTNKPIFSDGSVK